MGLTKRASRRPSVFMMMAQAVVIHPARFRLVVSRFGRWDRAALRFVRIASLAQLDPAAWRSRRYLSQLYRVNHSTAGHGTSACVQVSCCKKHPCADVQLRRPARTRGDHLNRALAPGLQSGTSETHLQLPDWEVTIPTCKLYSKSAILRRMCGSSTSGFAREQH